MSKSAVLVLLVCLQFCGLVYGSEDRGLFWELNTGRTTIFLLGSIHYADNSFYPLRKEIEEAFDVSDHLVVEVDVSRLNRQSILMDEARYAAGETVKDHISAETYALLLDRLEALGVSYQHVVKQKPGMLVLTLAGLQASAFGLDPKLGIDLHFIRQVEASSKNIIELETAQQQMDIFLDIEEDELLLKESLQSMDEAEPMMRDMVTFWKQGDERSLMRLLFEDSVANYPAFVSIFEALYYQRNQNMARAIESFLEKGGSYFVVVGAAHLLGERGIVNLLREQGYEVQRR